MDVIGDKIKAGDRLTCETPDPAGKLQKGNAYTARSAFSADGKRFVTLAESPGSMWEQSRFKKAAPSYYGWSPGPEVSAF